MEVTGAQHQTAKPILFNFYRGTSWRVRIALAYKGIEYEYRGVDIFAGMQHSDEYRARNPLGQVPTLFIDGVNITQTMAIIEYLDEARPGKKLLPSDPLQRAHARRLAEIVNSNIGPLQAKGLLKMVSRYSGKEADGLRWAEEVITNGFKGLEHELLAMAGIYSMGNEMSIVDCYLVPQVFNAIKFNVDMTQFPTISRVYNNLLKLDVVALTAPEYQPDCPEHLRKN